MEDRLPKIVWLICFLGLSNGGWMLFDGVHRLVRGDYIRMDGQLGPWAALVSAAGVDPMDMGVPFILLGGAWLVSCVGLLFRQTWAWVSSLVLAIISLMYCCIGTLLALITLILLLLKRTRKAFGVIKT